MYHEKNRRGCRVKPHQKRRTVHYRKVLNGSLLSCIIKSLNIINKKARILYHNERQKSTGITDGIGNKDCRERSDTEIGGDLRGTGLHGTVQEICPMMSLQQCFTDLTQVSVICICGDSILFAPDLHTFSALLTFLYPLLPGFRFYPVFHFCDCSCHFIHGDSHLFVLQQLS